MALGAQRNLCYRLILKEAGLLAFIGIVIGLRVHCGWTLDTQSSLRCSALGYFNFGRVVLCLQCRLCWQAIFRLAAPLPSIRCKPCDPNRSFHELANANVLSPPTL